MTTLSIAGRDDAAGTLRPSPVEAYRAGLLGGTWEDPSPVVAGAIGIAAQLEAATLLRPGPERDRMVADAAQNAIRLDSRGTEPLCGRVDWGEATPESTLRGLVELLARDHVGCASLGSHILDSLALMHPPVSLEGGRILAAQSRNAQAEGKDHLIDGRSRRLLGLARVLRRDELAVVGWTGLSVCAFARGNLPQVNRYSARALRHAERSGNPRLVSLALANSATAAGTRGDLQLSVEQLWRAFELADNEALRTLVLMNLAETFYRAGQFVASRAARVLALRAGAQHGDALVDLGGYAVSSAALGDVEGVRWAVRTAVALADRLRLSRGVAQGLLGCADACGTIGDLELAHELYRRGHDIAEARGYHDLRFRADPSEKPARQQFQGAAEEARKSMVDLAPDGIGADFILTSN